MGLLGKRKVRGQRPEALAQFGKSARHLDTRNAGSAREGADELPDRMMDPQPRSLLKRLRFWG